MTAGDVYYFDKIAMIFPHTTGVIATKVNLTELEKYCETAVLNTLSGEVFERTHCRSRLQVTVLGCEALDLLERSFLKVDHQITAIEIAKDHFFSNEHDAVEKANRLNECTRMVYARKSFVYDASKSVKPVVPRKDILSEKTGYFGSKNFEHAIYPRYSKLMKYGFPCVHTEFKINTAGRVRGLLGINSIRDIRQYDLKSNFERLKRKYIRYEEIDHETHGKFALGRNFRVYNSRINRLVKFPALNLGPSMASYRVMRGMEVEGAGELRTRYNELRKEVRDKKKKGGRLTPYEANKIDKLYDIKLNSFFKPVAEPL
jgi:hypothetical protein